MEEKLARFVRSSIFWKPYKNLMQHMSQNNFVFLEIHDQNALNMSVCNLIFVHNMPNSSRYKSKNLQLNRKHFLFNVHNI